MSFLPVERDLAKDEVRYRNAQADGNTAAQKPNTAASV
jgi:hypothetical protein